MSAMAAPMTVRKNTAIMTPTMRSAHGGRSYSAAAAYGALLEPFEQLQATIASDSRVIAGEERWADCMRAHGFSFRTHRDLWGVTRRAAGQNDGRRETENRTRRMSSRALESSTRAPS